MSKEYSVGALSAHFGSNSVKLSNDSFQDSLARQEKEVSEAISSLSRKNAENEAKSQIRKRGRDRDSSSNEQHLIQKRARKHLKRKYDSQPEETHRVRERANTGNDQVLFQERARKHLKRKYDSHQHQGKPENEVQYNSKRKKSSEPEGELETESTIKEVRDDPEKTARTLFVGNLPLTCNKKKLMKLFKQFGKVQSARFRSSLSKAHNNPKKAVFKSRKNTDLSSCLTAYVVMAELSSVAKALDLNGSELDGHRIRVDFAEKKSHEHKKSVFVGNLPYDVEEDEVWNFFQECGNINNVRLIRDGTLKIGKGFGYVSFHSEDGVVLALQKNGQNFKEREIRVFPAKSEKQLKKNNYDSSQSRTANPKHNSRTANRFKQNRNFEGLGSSRGRETKKKILKSIRHPRKKKLSGKQVDDNAGLW